MIQIQKEPNADSRTAKDNLTREELMRATENHIGHVRDALLFFSQMIGVASDRHDHTKLSNFDAFYDALKSPDIKQTEWYTNHISEERHHLKSKVPYKVNLIDVIEHLSDCVMAGLARSGQIYDTDLLPELLFTAYQNTIELLKSQVIVMQDDNVLNQPITEE